MKLFPSKSPLLNIPVINKILNKFYKSPHICIKCNAGSSLKDFITILTFKQSHTIICSKCFTGLTPTERKVLFKRYVTDLEGSLAFLGTLGESELPQIEEILDTFAKHERQKEIKKFITDDQF